jgi:threonine/homoserine/homoserine lactone efflux protein
VIAVCGLIDLILGASITLDAGGIAGAIREHGLVHWIKPPWVSRAWAEQPRHYVVISRFFGAAFAIFGVLAALYAA